LSIKITKCWLAYTEHVKEMVSVEVLRDYNIVLDLDAMACSNLYHCSNQLTKNKLFIIAKYVKEATHIRLYCDYKLKTINQFNLIIAMTCCIMMNNYNFIL